ncbi:NAD-binding protein [Desulfurococcaceae archaeon MEX13E-LK6-19]|nr:NAD-binding protein [Desulfurococcaceae archaeon MEX13E-LK6-19]
MRVIVAGASRIGKHIAQQLAGEGHDVVLLEPSEEVAKQIANELDCTVIHGDPTNVNTLREAGVENVDYFIAAMDDDKDNIIAGVAAKNLGAKEVIIILNDESYEQLALNLGIYGIVSPSKLAVLQILALVKGFDIVNLTTVIKSDARFFTGVISEKLDGKKISEIKLPGDSMIIAVYRGEEFLLPKNDLVLRKGDEVVVITRDSDLSKVKEFFSKQQG